MAKTLIDAFVTTFDFDPKGFKKGAQDSERDLEHLKKTTEETANHMKEQGAKAKEFYGELIAKASELFAILAGGHELKEFITHTMEADLATGRLAANVGLSVDLSVVPSISSIGVMIPAVAVLSFR